MKIENNRSLVCCPSNRELPGDILSEESTELHDHRGSPRRKATLWLSLHFVSFMQKIKFVAVIQCTHCSVIRKRVSE